MKNAKFFFLLVFVLAGSAEFCQSACTIRQPKLRVRRADIFSNQQEQWLGDAQAEMIEPQYTLLPSRQSAYLDRIGQRLLQKLPPTRIHYTFRVFESPYLRAFSLAGGHVYISRKLIMDAQSEDELAAMLAQEIGRIYIHHSASAVTRLIESTLHVKHLDGRADVYDKFERMLNMPADPYAYLSPDEQRDDDLMADRVGLYAMVQAHFNPQAFPVFLDRINNNGGYTGNLLTDVFDLTPTISIRVRMANTLVHSLPPGCHQRPVADQEKFIRFQQRIDDERINPFVPATPGMDSLALQPIEPVLRNLALSQDGRYVLTQDDYQIHALSVTPPRVLFSIDAFKAQKAQFTPDSKSLVLSYNDMHVEKWQLSTGQLISAQDFIDYAGCVQTSLSPDGTAMACISPYYGLTGTTTWLKLADITGGKMLYENHDFSDNFEPAVSPATMRWSRDGRYFVAASGLTAISYDLSLRSMVRRDGALGDLRQQRFAFVGSDNMLSTCDWNFRTGAWDQLFTMCYTTFPGGQTLKKMKLPLGSLRSVADSHHLLFGPLRNAAVALIDPVTAKVQDEFPDAPVDLNGNTVAFEMAKGGIGIGQLHGDIRVVALPVNPFTSVQSTAFSPDSHYLTASNRARGAIWDIHTGKLLTITSPFLGATLDDAGDLQADTIPQEITANTNTFEKPLRTGTVSIQATPTNFLQSFSYFVRLDAYDALSHTHLWSKAYEDGVPQIIPSDADSSLLVTSYAAWNGHGKLKYTSDQPFGAHLAPKGSVVEVISNRTGKTEHLLFTPQFVSTNCYCQIHAANLFGNLLADYGNLNETTVYRVDTGKRLFAFFGYSLAGDDTMGMIAATDRLQELNLYDSSSGRRLAHYLLDQAVLAAHFVPARRQLLVLTASQHIYRINLSEPVQKLRTYP